MSSTTTDAADASQRLFAVIGATGQQGGATARALLAAGAGVRALVRDPRAQPARALADQGAEVVGADIDDPASLRSAFTDVDGLFAMTTFTGLKGSEGEVEHGMQIADAAREVGVPQVVYSSVGGTERATGIPHFESKRRVEEYMSFLGLSTSFVRPTFFMENFTYFLAPQQEDGVVVLRAPLAPGVPLQMVAVEDIGAVAAAALLDAASVPGGAVEIAGDELTGEQIAAVYGQRTGLPARFKALPLSVVEDADQKAMFTWFAQRPAYQADFDATRRLAPGVRDFAAWLATRA
ncbi:MAG: NmrA/HSCARG family protein [Actinomycetota bacterium]|nr:NmrA/HSCARG family protein [Actinomycetota bacterium]